MRRGEVIKKFLGIMLIFGMMSCEEIISPKAPEASPIAVFDHLWNDINNRYSFFEEKEIDWEEVKRHYKPLIHAQMTPEDLFDVLGDMLGELKDGHVNLLSTFNRSRNWSWFEGFPLFYDQQLIDGVYLGTNFRIIGPLHAQTVDNMLYVNYRSFERQVSHQHLNEIIRLLQFHEGLIIDVRNNGGGSLQNALNIASRLIEEEVTFARQRFKTGPGRNDFTPWSDRIITPFVGDRYLGKVAVLINRRSYSSTTFFAQMMSVLPQARLFGDQTGGGGGIPVFAELPNGWTYRFSGSQTIDLNGNQIEFGVQVDEDLTSPELVISGRDHFIDSAVSWLKEQAK